MAFQEFPKIARLSRECIVTEKLDGTNAQLFIDTADVPQEVPVGDVPWAAEIGNLRIAAGSRSRYLTKETDNFGFHAWVTANAQDLVALGPGRHYGEWWGSGIQRGYGLQKGEKRFSLFNTSRWASEPTLPKCCSVVPVLYQGDFDTRTIHEVLYNLASLGSVAAPGFMKPEGVVIFHTHSGFLFKKTIEKDEVPKGRIDS